MLYNLTEIFLRIKKVQGVSERTIVDYERCFKWFFTNLGVTKENLDDKVLEYFGILNYKAPATYNLQRCYLSCFFTWAVEEGHLAYNPIKKHKIKKKKDEGKARSIDEDIIVKFLKAIDITTFAGFRDYCLFIFTLDTGIRPKEAISILTTDLNLNNAYVIVRKEIAKTRESRMLPLSPQVVLALTKLEIVRPKEWKYVFTTCEGNQLTPERWQKRLKGYSKKIGYKIRPYDLRHTFAIMFLRNNGHVFALQKELGHSDLQMTKRYVKLANNDLKEVHSYASPINNILKRTTRIQKLFK